MVNLGGLSGCGNQPHQPVISGHGITPAVPVAGGEIEITIGTHGGGPQPAEPVLKQPFVRFDRVESLPAPAPVRPQQRQVGHVDRPVAIQVFGGQAGPGAAKPFRDHIQISAVQVSGPEGDFFQGFVRGGALWLIQGDFDAARNGQVPRQGPRTLVSPTCSCEAWKRS